MKHDILCIGSVLWDVIGRTTHEMKIGSDQPGRITRLPGGVAMNIAMTFARFGLKPGLISAIGRDHEGEELLMQANRLGLVTSYVHRPKDLPTDRYMAIEGPSGLVAALADAHSLEAAGAAILSPLEDGTLGSANTPYKGIITLDGNLTVDLLSEIALRPSFSHADLRVAPASPGKAKRLRPLMTHPGVTLYVNREEAGLLTETRPETAPQARRRCLMRAPHGPLLPMGAILPPKDTTAEGCSLPPAPPFVYVASPAQVTLSWPPILPQNAMGTPC